MRGFLPQGVWARYTLCCIYMRTNIQTHAPTGGAYSTQNTSLHRGHPRGQGQGQFHPNLMEGKDIPHSSPSQMSGLLSAATPPLLTTGAELETSTASTLPSLPVKVHLSALSAGGWSCGAHSGDRLLKDSPGDKQGQESKQGFVSTESKIDNHQQL